MKQFNKNHTFSVALVASAPFLGFACAQAQPKKPLAAKPKSVAAARKPVAAPKPFAVSPNFQPAFRADAFNDSIGINSGPIQFNTYKGYDPQLFHELGVRHYRTFMKNGLTRPDHGEQIKQLWLSRGVQIMPLIDPRTTKTGAEVVAALRAYDPRSIAELEGANEVNNKFGNDFNLKFGGKTDEAAGALFMDDVYKSLKADPQLARIPVVAYSAIFTDYALARGHKSFDFANMHSYQGYGVPTSSLLMNETRFNNILPAGATIKPYIPTETGYNVEADVSNGTFKVGSYRAQALNIPMLLAEYFRHGIPRTYLFSLDNGDGYGLLEHDNATRRPSYFAFQNLLKETRDANWNPKTLKWEGGDNFSPRALLFDATGAPDTIHTLTLQRKNGEYLLMIWNEVVNFDQNQKKDIENAPVPVTLRFATPVASSAQILTQNAKGGYDTTNAKLQNGVLKLDVPSSVTIIRLKSGAVTDKIAPAAPAKVTGSATETQVKIAWPRSTSKDVAGYFVFRNDAPVATVAGLAFEDNSEWIRPALGYRYAVQAFDRAGNMSPRRDVVIQTPDRRPDLVVSEIQSLAPKAGEEVRFRATVTNIGNASTPSKTGISVTFYIDGQYTTYGGDNGAQVLKAGQSRVVESGGTWKATPGAHNLRAMTDDVNRVVGEGSETNNFADRSLNVGASGSGFLEGMTGAATGQVDLTREGTLDWVHWGQGDGATIHRKAGVAAQISGELTKSGEGFRAWTGGFTLSAKWNDGTPTKDVSDTHSSLWWNGVGHGYTLSAPADTTERTLKLYVGGIEGARGKLTAKLSDGSAPEYVSTTWDANRSFEWAPIPGEFSAVYTIRFRAAKPGQTLQVTWALDGEPNRFLGQARMQAATLSR